MHCTFVLSLRRIECVAPAQFPPPTYLPPPRLIHLHRRSSPPQIYHLLCLASTISLTSNPTPSSASRSPCRAPAAIRPPHPPSTFFRIRRRFPVRVAAIPSTSSIRRRSSALSASFASSKALSKMDSNFSITPSNPSLYSFSLA